MQFGTTMAFLEYFGLGRLEDLPAADELRRIPVVRPESLATADAAAGSAVSELPLEQADPEVAGGRGVTPEAPVVPESNARLEEPPAA
jgi:segregation and condensation protein B